MCILIGIFNIIYKSELTEEINNIDGQVQDCVKEVEDGYYEDSDLNVE